MEIIKLNLIPSGVNPTCHCSQYDNGRVIRIDLFDGLTPYVLQSGDTVTLNVRKPDNTIVTASLTATQGNTYVNLVTTEQICACVGYNLCDLTLTNGNKKIGTLNFIMIVERDVLADGIESQSVIKDLDTLVQKAISENIYNVMPIETDQGDIVTFTDGAENIPVKSLVSEIVATGGGGTPDAPIAINGFDSGIITRLGKNWFDDTVGTHTITANTDRINVIGDVWLKANQTYVISCKQTPNAVSSFVRNTLLVVGNGQTVYNSAGNDYTIKPMVFTPTASGIYSIRVWGHTLPVDTDYTEFQVELGDTPSEYHAYNGNTYTFAFGQTVYGGYFDNKGNLVVIRVEIIFNGSENWQPNGERGVFIFTSQIPNIDTTKPITFEEYQTIATGQAPANDGQANYNSARTAIQIHDERGMTVANYKTFLASHNIKMLYYLANPIVLSIASQDIPTAFGENNFYSNTGDVDVTIRADIGLYIDKRLNTTRSTPTLSLSKGNSTLSETQVKYEDPVEESEDNNEER